jgi:signal transduction histidine kinase
LRDNVLASEGLACALERYVDRIDRQNDLRIGLQLQPGVRLPRSYQESLYRLAREGITNVIKHAQARHASVILTADDAGISLRVEDDGVGFRQAEPECASCGLRLLRERVRTLGGTLRLGNLAQGGAFLDVTLPLPEET